MGLPLAIWKTGSPVRSAEREHGAFAEMIQRVIGDAWKGDYLVVDCEEEAAAIPLPDEVAGVIITGSSSRVGERAPWMLKAEGALRGYAGTSTPVLGICFGHQLLGQALGGDVVANPRGVELGLVPVEIVREDELVRDLFDESAPLVVMTHFDSVHVLPPTAEVLARTELEPHAAVRFEERIWGVQFHPEMDERVLNHYVRERRADTAQGAASEARVSVDGVASEWASRLLARFVALCDAEPVALSARPLSVR